MNLNLPIKSLICCAAYDKGLGPNICLSQVVLRGFSVLDQRRDHQGFHRGKSAISIRIETFTWNKSRPFDHVVKDSSSIHTTVKMLGQWLKAICSIYSDSGTNTMETCPPHCIYKPFTSDDGWNSTPTFWSLGCFGSSYDEILGYVFQKWKESERFSPSIGISDIHILNHRLVSQTLPVPGEDVLRLTLPAPVSNVGWRPGLLGWFQQPKK